MDSSLLIPHFNTRKTIVELHPAIFSHPMSPFRNTTKPSIDRQTENQPGNTATSFSKSIPGLPTDGFALPTHQSESNLPQLPLAPVFYPTDAEFSDPMAYIQKIAPNAKLAGICKIVPPAHWKPLCMIRPDNHKRNKDSQKHSTISKPSSSSYKGSSVVDGTPLVFTPRIMQLNYLSGRSRNTLNFIDQLAKFHINIHNSTQQSSLSHYHSASAYPGANVSSSSHPFPTTAHPIAPEAPIINANQELVIPIINKKAIDLLGLKRLVDSNGGYERVNKNKLWASIGRTLGLYSPTISSMSHTLKKTYASIIMPYERFIASNSLDDLQTVSSKPPLSSVSSNPAVQDSKADVSFPKLKVILNHSSSADESSSRLQRSLSKHGSLTEEEVELMQGLDANGMPKKRMKRKTNNTVMCERCFGESYEYDTLQCEECSKYYHLYCINPPLKVQPLHDWTCTSCIKTTGNDYGFEDAEPKSVREFKTFADAFKQNWFREYPKNFRGQVMVSERECEREFWRLVESPYDVVRVEYGADVHSSLHGSGFPSCERQPLDSYSNCPWNLNNLSLLPGSLLRHIRNDISGMTNPWLYFGMVFSAFCWHTEDHFTYSINYLHWGDTKTWYGIPSTHAGAFEAAMRKTFPELFQKNPDLLFHLTTLMSPYQLKENKVDVYTMDQHAGEFIVTFPRAYHAGFNHGMNLAEAVNFVLPDWLPYGSACEVEYSLYSKQPVFSHDELLIRMANDKIEYDGAKWLSPAFQHMRVREQESMQTVLLHPTAKHVNCSIAKTIVPPNITESCSICKRFLFLSHVKRICCSSQPVVCYAHLGTNCVCEEPSFVVNVRYSDEDLAGLQVNIEKVAMRPVYWNQKVETSLALIKFQKCSFKELQDLYEEGLTMNDATSGSTMDDLTYLINKGNKWIESVQNMLRCRGKLFQAASLGLLLDKDTNRPPSANSSPYKYNRTEQNNSQAVLLDDLMCLIEEGKDLPFETTEGEELIKWFDQYESFESNAKETLAYSSEYTLEELKQLRHQGALIGIQCPILIVLENEISKREWHDVTADLLAQNKLDPVRHPISIHEINTIVKKGLSGGILYTDPLMKHCLTKKRSCDEWAKEAQLVLDTPIVTLGELKTVSEKGYETVFDPEIMKKIGAAMHRIEDWVERAKVYVDMIQVPSRDGKDIDSDDKLPVEQLLLQKKQTIDIKLVQALIDEGSRIPSPLKYLLTLNKAVKVSHSWCADTRAHIIGKSTTSATLMDLIDQGLDNFHKQKHDIFVKPIDNPEQYACICRHKIDLDLNFLVQCKVCKHRYHLGCLKITKRDIKEHLRDADSISDDVSKKSLSNAFVCPICTPDSFIQRAPQKRLTIEILRVYLQSALRMKMVLPLEVRRMAELVALNVKWEEQVAELLKDLFDKSRTIKENEVAFMNNQLTPEWIKYVLRTTEGMHIHLPDAIHKLRKALEVKLDVNEIHDDSMVVSTDVPMVPISDLVQGLTMF